MVLVQFAPQSSLVQPSFWHRLSDVKIDVLRLSDEPFEITASYSAGRSVLDRETGTEIPLPSTLTIGAESFDEQQREKEITVAGTFRNFNTIEDFRSVDKTKLFNDEADKIWKAIVEKRESSQLNRFMLISYADLKKYKFYYWFAFPAFVAKPPWETDGWQSATNVFTNEELTQIHAELRPKLTTVPFFLVKSNPIRTASVDDYAQFFADVPPDARTIAFVDPSADPAIPGWPLRNLLTYLRTLYPEVTSSVRVLCWRDRDPPTNNGWKSRFGVLTAPPSEIESSARPSAVGWEKNPQGKLGPRLADLAPMMDPTQLANQAVDLNLKLMRWRILPELDLDSISSTKCLLLGAGTLGCYVARSLTAWGVRKITLVDSGLVSFSNPVRQPLFEFQDCLNGGKPKAECAANHLKRIYPGIDATGHQLAIPMPGHSIPDNPAALSQAKVDVGKLELLIEEHDAVFLLMDSRESRWLPTVIGAAKEKIVINAALGFDTFLVMRHGPRVSTTTNQQRLGCYYCNDIVAPADSLTDRTLDQMCTVTRPGLAPMAASTAVELLVSLVQHPKRIHAPAPLPNQDLGNLTENNDPSASILGVVPHQLRGFLAQFRNLPLVGAAYDKCTACSEVVLQAYEKDGFDMLLKAFNDNKYLESLTGLDQLFSEGEALDWDEEGSDDF